MTRHVLMCEPTHYRIAYEINPWMRRANAVISERAHEQWRGLRDTLEDLGVQVEQVVPGDTVPDMTFTANAGLAVGRRFIPANFRYEERRPEAERFATWAEARGYEVVRIHEPHYWEGEGDVLASDGRLFAGYRFRTEERALDHLDELLGAEVVRLELADPRFYHLDTCFCPLGEGRALYVAEAFSEQARARLAESFDDLVDVPLEDALRFACNAVLVDSTVVLNSECHATEAALEARGFVCRATPTSEFIKAGGSVKCLLLTLDTFGEPPAGASDADLGASSAGAVRA